MGSSFVKDVNMQVHLHDQGISMIVNDIGNCGCVLLLGFLG